MLKKKLCKKCWENNSGWTRWDERHWNKKGIVHCPYEYREKGNKFTKRNIIDEPPEKCPFLLEQLLMKED